MDANTRRIRSQCMELVFEAQEKLRTIGFSLSFEVIPPPTHGGQQAVEDPRPPGKRRPLSTSQVVEHFEVSERTLNRKRNEGKLRGRKTAKGYVYTETDLQKAGIQKR